MSLIERDVPWGCWWHHRRHYAVHHAGVLKTVQRTSPKEVYLYAVQYGCWWDGESGLDSLQSLISFVFMQGTREKKYSPRGQAQAGNRRRPFKGTDSVAPFELGRVIRQNVQQSYHFGKNQLLSSAQAQSSSKLRCYGSISFNAWHNFAGKVVHSCNFLIQRKIQQYAVGKISDMPLLDADNHPNNCDITVRIFSYIEWHKKNITECRLLCAIPVQVALANLLRFGTSYGVPRAYQR